MVAIAQSQRLRIAKDFITFWFSTSPTIPNQARSIGSLYWPFSDHTPRAKGQQWCCVLFSHLSVLDTLGPVSAVLKVNVYASWNVALLFLVLYIASEHIPQRVMAGYVDDGEKIYVSKFEVNNGPRLVLLVYYVEGAGKHRLFQNTVFPDHSWWNTARATHDDVIKWKHFPRNWPFVREIHRSPVNFPHKGQWRGALMFSLIYAWINDWVNNREAGDSRRQHGHYDVIVMTGLILLTAIWWTMVEFREWMSNHIHTKLWTVITHQGPVSLTVFPVHFECD